MLQMILESLLAVVTGWVCFIPSVSPVNPGKSKLLWSLNCFVAYVPQYYLWITWN